MSELIERPLLEAINRRVYQRFPEVAGSHPRIQRFTLDTGEERLILTYRRRVHTADGRILPRWVRVITTPKGRILKITTSR